MVFIACLILLVAVPKEQVASLTAKGVSPQDVFKAENDARTTLAQIIGGFAVLVGLGFAWKNIAASTKNLELTRDGQVTDRFYKAIEQLGATGHEGNPKLELRLGGIYALERIARDSEKDYWPIMEILTAYVRGKENNFPDPLTEDIQAIVTVIRRRERRYEKSDQRLDLHGANLHGANLKGAHLEHAILYRMDLEGADLRGAHLDGADLEGTNLHWAHLDDVNLDDVNLTDAYVYGAYMSKARNLDQRWLDLMFGDETTQLPAGLTKPESWKHKEATFEPDDEENVCRSARVTNSTGT